MRHGIRDSSNVTPEPEMLNHPEGYKCIKGTELGCYFCNDVTAPGNVRNIYSKIFFSTYTSSLPSKFCGVSYHEQIN